MNTQAILKILDDMYEKWPPYRSDWYNAAIREIKEYILEMEENEDDWFSLDSQWIDVKKWNPKWFYNYIVTNWKSSFEAWYSDVDKKFKHIDDSWDCKWITHYMELPLPPNN